MVAPTTGDDYGRCSFENGRCRRHGGEQRGTRFVPICQTTEVLEDVKAERARQFAQYGTNENLAWGTGPGATWLSPLCPGSAELIQKALRAEYEVHEAVYGQPTWMHLIREEVAEAFAENDPARLREELIQVAALAVSFIEKIDAKEA